MRFLNLILLLSLVFSLTSCEKVALEDFNKGGGGTINPSNASLVLHVDGVINAQYDNEDVLDSRYIQSRAIEPVSNVCSKLTIALYKDGVRTYYKNQSSSDGNFGDFSISLGEGTYTLLVLAHSNSKNATTTNLNELSFDGKVSDTFRYCEVIELKAGSNALDIQLSRVTAMFRLEILDDIPENAKQLKFYYTGGSSTLDGMTGYGCKDSRQTEYRDIQKGVSIYEVYTFPHSEQKKLKMTISALDASGGILCQKVFENVEVESNIITHYKGKMFEGVTPPSIPDNFMPRPLVETDWVDEKIVEF